MKRIFAAMSCALATFGTVEVRAGAVEVNPASLSASMPEDRARIDFDATLNRRIKADPSSLNPILMFTAVDAAFEDLIWARPLVLTSRMRIEVNPAVAVSYEESADLREGTLVLRPDVTWQDGAAFTVEDVVFSWRLIMDDRVASRRARTAAEQIASCEVIDAQTVRFVFREARSANVFAAALPILPRHLYEPNLADDPTLEKSDANLALNRQPVGNGPYRLAEWVSGQRLVLERWEGYAGSRPAMRRMVFKVIPDNNAALLAFESGQIDETELTPQQFALETDGARFASVGVKAKADGWTTYYIGWNMDPSVPYFRDRLVRQAMCFAVNTELIIERVFFGLFSPSAGLYPPGSRAHDADLRGYPYDLRKAGEFLDAAGWRVDDQDGFRYRQTSEDQAGRTRFSFTLNLPQGSQTAPKIADFLQQDLARLGIEMKTQVLDWAVFNQRNYDHAFEAYLSAWTAGPDPDEARNLLHSEAINGGRNYVSFSVPEVDALFDRARSAEQVGVQQNLHRQIAQTVLLHAPYTFLVDAPWLWAFNKKLHGVEFSPRGPAHFHPGALTWWFASQD